MKKAIYQLPLHPFVMAAVFVANTANTVEGYVNPAAAALGLLALWAVAALLLAALARGRHWVTGALALAAPWALMLSYAFVETNIKAFGPLYNMHAERYLLALSLIASLGWLWAWRRKPVPYTANAYLNLTALCVLAYELLLLAGHLYSYDPQFSTLHQYPLMGKADEARRVQAAPMQAAPHPDSTRPHIFLFLLDGYPSAQVLQTYWGFNNHAFYHSLRQQGFWVQPNSRSNYDLTRLTMASMFSLHYLPKTLNKNSNLAMSACLHLINRNPTLDTLKAHGYQLHNLSVFLIDDNAPLLGGAIRGMGGYNFFELLMLRTVLHSVWLASPQHAKAANMVDNLWLRGEKLEEITNQIQQQGKQPRFTYFHSMLTHHPTDMNNNRRTEVNPYPGPSLGNFVTDMELQVRRSNQAVLKAIAQIGAATQGKALIIVMSDHGWRKMRRVPLEKRKALGYQNFCAVYFPDRDYRALPPGTTPVNLMRAALNKAIGTRFAPLPNRSGL